jgi:hypothetical protein
METEEKTTAARLSTARSRELGEELRRARHRARMSAGVVAGALGWSLGKLSKLETGSRGTSPWEIGTLVGRLGADKPTRDRILTIATEPDTGTFVRLHGRSADDLLAVSVHEQTARTITVYEPLVIPCLAQTERYARVLTGSNAVADARKARQDRLRRAGGPDIVLYVHEAALRMVVGGPEVMRDQMLHLSLMCAWERMTARLVPASAPSHTAVRHPATLLTFDAPTKPLAYVETDTATVFHDAPEAVAAYNAKMRHLAGLALSAEQTSDAFARWADAYDRQSR